MIVSCLSLLASLSAFATFHTVNNYNPNPGEYMDVASALAVAVSGDTILIQGTGTNYSGFTCNTDSIHFFGSGVYPQGTQAVATYINGTIQLGEDVNGCTISGIIAASIDTDGNNVDDILIERCYLFSNGISIDRSFCNNWVVRNCIFWSSNTNVSIANTNNITNLVFAFNVFNGFFSGGGDQVLGIILRNNLFLSSSAYCITDTQFAIIENNIFHSRVNTANSSNVLNCTFNNNLTDPDSSNASQSNALPPPGNTGTGNIERMDPMFVQGVPISTASNWQWNPAGRNYRLLPASPGAGAATDGGDLGIYGGHASTGGVNLFSETMEPLLPFVQELDIQSSSVPTGGTLNVNITLRNPETEVD